MSVFKALFSGIANFFKVLFGGLFKSVDDAGMTAPVTWSQADSVDAPSPAPVGASGASATMTPPTTPSIAPEPEIKEATAIKTAEAFDPNAEIVVKELVRKEGPIAYASLNTLATPRPNRRPGKSLSSFRTMVRDMQAAASQS